MEVKFSEHALDQLKIRSNTTQNMVVETLKNPDETLQSYRNRQLFRKHYKKGVLEIVVTEEDNKIIIITQYFLEQPL